MYLQKVISENTANDEKQDPDVSGTDTGLRIRIHTKMSRIHNTRTVNPDSVNPDPYMDPDPAFQVNPDTDPDHGI
jgi:hypothetical protein